MNDGSDPSFGRCGINVILSLSSVSIDVTVESDDPVVDAVPFSAVDFTDLS